MAERSRWLVVTAAPDDRTSTRSLRSMVEHLRARPDVEVELWFLRGQPDQAWGPCRVVDDLRTWRPAIVAERLGLARIADRLRGARLRRWRRLASPDVVVLDDGLGGRVLGRREVARAQIVLRRNAAPPADADRERTWQGDVAVDLSPPGAPTGGGARPNRSLPNLHLVDVATRRTGPSAAGARPLLVGWGGDGWVDGSDLFVRVLWHLEHGCGVVASGRWFDEGANEEHRARLQGEVRRCGLEGRLEIVARAADLDRWAGEMVVLPARAPVALDDVLAAMAHGREVVTFAPAPLRDPAVHAVAPLDLGAAAQAIAGALAKPSPPSPPGPEWHDAERWVAQLVDATRSQR